MASTKITNIEQNRIENSKSKTPQIPRSDYGLQHSRSIESNSESSRKQEQMTGGNRKQDKTSLSSIKTGRISYDSYRKFNPDQYVENSPEWQKAIHQYLLDMRKNGHYIQEVNIDKVRR